MKKFLYISFLACFLMSGQIMAQSLNLPAASPRAHLKQTIGLTDIDVDYSRPGVKNRTIFGGLLPYDSVWRTGANAATTIEFSDDVTVAGQKLAKGKYGLFTIPRKTQWTVIFNNNPNQWGAYSYKKAEDALRINAKAGAGSFTETFTIEFDSIRDNSASLVLSWEKTRVSIPMEFATTDKALKNIKAATDNAASAYARGANFYLMNNLDLTTAGELADKALMLDNSYYNNWVKAQILAKQGDFTKAADYADKAIAAGKASGPDSNYAEFSDRIEKAAKEYHEKAGPVKGSKKKK